MPELWVRMVKLKPTVISTFCGTGGSSLGYKWSGFKELLAIDFDSHAIECFKLNFPEVPVWHKSVTEITGQEILDFCKIKKGELHVFDGSPPCQGFSTAGKREVKDPRNDLFLHYLRLIQEIEPMSFVMENVPGMAKGKMRGRFIEIMMTLKSANYNVKCKQMNSKYYGVPQSRERLIFIGIRKDLDLIPSFPIPSTKLITSKQAIGHLEQLRPELKLNNIDNWDGKKSGRFSSIRIKSDRPCPTLCKTNRPNSTTGLNHYKYPQSLAIDEMKILCSFPENWKLFGAYSAQSARLGNAVMPKFMQAIAENLKITLGFSP